MGPEQADVVIIGGGAINLAVHQLL